MSFVVSARPQRLNVFQSGFCHFWANDKACRYCDIVTHFKQQRAELGIPARLTPSDVSETIAEALKEPGRFTGICLTSGSNTNGLEPFDQEVDFYIELLQAIGENFAVKKFPSQLIATAFTEKQLARLYGETGLISYTADLEVLNENLFGWICPGKTEWIGYMEWRDRLFRAVGIFGRGNVSTGIVGGVELAKPYGFEKEEDALKSTLEEADFLASNGVNTVYIVWAPKPGSFFRDQQNPSLDYFVRLAKGIHEIRVKYNLPIDYDDYRRCGNHPDTDLSRLW
jgi:biotin synthase-like enzyme